MEQKRKFLAAALALMMAGAAFAGCGGDGGNKGGSAKAEINVAMNAEPETYDLGKTTGTTCKQMLLGNVFELLVNFDSNYKAQPELAEKIDISKDYTEYTYYLRKGVLFHNGQEMKADDVVASMNRWIETVGQAKSAVGDARFEKVDDYTVKIKMAQPLSTLNDLMGGCKPFPIIVPKSVIDNADEKTGMIKEFIGTGPYMIDDVQVNNYIKLKKFDNYKPYGEKGKVSGWVGYKEAKTPTIIFHYVTDSSTRVAGMQSGEYDLALQLPFDDYDQFHGKDDYKVYMESQGEIGMVYNKKSGISTNKDFRKAVNAALNRQDIMTAAYTKSDFFKLTPSVVQSNANSWYTEAGKDVYNPASIEKAKELLTAAGYGGEEFNLMVSNHYPEFYNAAIVVERELKDAGVNVKLNVVDWSTYLSHAKDASAYDAFITGFPEVVAPTMCLYLSPNWNGWSNDPTLQGMMSNIAHATDLKAAKAEWEKAQTYCWTDYFPASKFGNRYAYSVSSAKVNDMVFFEGPHMWNLTVTE